MTVRTVSNGHGYTILLYCNQHIQNMYLCLYTCSHVPKIIHDCAPFAMENRKEFYNRVQYWYEVLLSIIGKYVCFIIFFIEIHTHSFSKFLLNNHKIIQIKTRKLHLNISLQLHTELVSRTSHKIRKRNYIIIYLSSYGTCTFKSAKYNTA